MATGPSGQRRDMTRARLSSCSDSPLRQVCNRAPERAAMKATRRVLDARDSTPTIRTNLPYRINTSKGERWFCTESEARAAGWRRSRK